MQETAFTPSVPIDIKRTFAHFIEEPRSVRRGRIFQIFTILRLRCWLEAFETSTKRAIRLKVSNGPLIENNRYIRAQIKHFLLFGKV